MKGVAWRMRDILPQLSTRGYGANAPGALVGPQCGVLFARNANCVTRAGREGVYEIGEREDADAAQTELRRHFLDGRLRPLPALLAVERERDACGLRAGRVNDVDGFADRRSRRNHVVDDHHATLERSADDVAAFTMILRLLAIEGPGHAAMMMLRERNGGRGGEWNSFVGRAEQHVELEAGARERGRVTLPEHRDRFAVVEESRVE